MSLTTHSDALSGAVQLDLGRKAAYAEVFKEIPDLRVIVNHLGVPKVADLESNSYVKGMTDLAALPNVYLKVGSMGYTDPEGEQIEFVKEKVSCKINVK